MKDAIVFCDYSMELFVKRSETVTRQINLNLLTPTLPPLFFYTFNPNLLLFCVNRKGMLLDVGFTFYVRVHHARQSG